MFPEQATVIPARPCTHSRMQECAMTQPTQIAPEPNQQAVKDHVKAVLRRLPRKPPRNEQAHQRFVWECACSDGALKQRWRSRRIWRHWAWSACCQVRTLNDVRQTSPAIFSLGKAGSGRTVEALLEGFQSRYKALLFRNMAICVVELD